jgi:hypothetical protein
MVIIREGPSALAANVTPLPGLMLDLSLDQVLYGAAWVPVAVSGGGMGGLLCLCGRRPPWVACCLLLLLLLRPTCAVVSPP